MDHTKISDSNSLWNYTVSSGWTKEELEIFKIALTKFGIGNWKKIKEVESLKHKSISQMNVQTQRLLGQQSLTEYLNLHVNLEKVYINNIKKKDLFRKNNIIINTSFTTIADRRALRKQNKIMFGLPKTIVNKIVIPELKVENFDINQVVNSNVLSTIEKIEKLEEYKQSFINKK